MQRTNKKQRAHVYEGAQAKKRENKVPPKKGGGGNVCRKGCEWRTASEFFVLAEIYFADMPHADDPEDAYDACKDSALVDTLVEGGVVLLIAALINVIFWGIVRFGVADSMANSLAAVA